MAVCAFNDVRICGVKTVVPEHCINIDDELQYFDNNPKKLARQKKMNGYGRRYIADDRTTVTDMACSAANMLLEEMGVARSEIDLLVFVNQKPDFPEPCDACVAHGRLGLKKDCTALDINLGCSGYSHALMTAHALMASGGYSNALLLAGDLCGRINDQSNRKVAPVFGDAASATLLTYERGCGRKAYFVTGTDGSGYDKIIHPAGGMYLPIGEDVLSIKVTDQAGNGFDLLTGQMKGEDVFNFTMEVGPQLIKDTMAAAGWTNDDVDLFSIHQANKQIVEMVVDRAGIPVEKAPVGTFSKYANNSTNSVVTVICDQGFERELKNVVLSSFGIGLSWGGAAVDLSGMHNGGIATYKTPVDALDRKGRINYWIKHFGGEVES